MFSASRGDGRSGCKSAASPPGGSAESDNPRLRRKLEDVLDRVDGHEQGETELMQRMLYNDIGEDGVVTHHAPSRQSVSPEEDDQPYTPAYASDLDALVTASGAALGAAIAVLIPVQVALLGLGLVNIFAFVGALAAIALVYRVAGGGDLGAPQVQKFDIETWMPSRAGYGETHSASRFHDFQARRLNLRYRDGARKVRFCHTLNNTVIASPRVLIHLAAAGGELDVLDVLLERRADVNAIDGRGRTPLHLAVASHDLDTVIELMAAGADPSLEDERGRSARDLADRMDDPDYRASVVERGIDPDSIEGGECDGCEE